MQIGSGNTILQHRIGWPGHKALPVDMEQIEADKLVLLVGMQAKGDDVTIPVLIRATHRPDQNWMGARVANPGDAARTIEGDRLTGRFETKTWGYHNNAAHRYWENSSGVAVNQFGVAGIASPNVYEDDVAATHEVSGLGFALASFAATEHQIDASFELSGHPDGALKMTNELSPESTPCTVPTCGYAGFEYARGFFSWNQIEDPSWHYRGSQIVGPGGDFGLLFSFTSNLELASWSGYPMHMGSGWVAS